MKKGIRGIAVGMTIASVLGFSFYGADIQAKENGSEAGKDTKTKAAYNIRPQDDFFGYVNANAVREAEIDPKYGFGSFNECGRITDKKLFELIDEISIISEIHKKFYKTMLQARYDKILKYSYDKLMEARNEKL